MKILTTINDVRKYRQLGKQLNSDNFEGRVREVQENELTELLGNALSYDLFNFLDNGFSSQAGTFTRQSITQFTIVGADLSAWTSDYSLRINSNVFVNVVSATFGGADTIIIVEGYDLPSEITTVEYSAQNKYIKLLNGESYSKNGDTISFNGLRPFIIWKFLAIFATDGNVKHSDTGNFSITSANFQNPTRAEIAAAKSTYLENSTREENRIIDYLNEKNTDFPLWEQKGNENIIDFDFIVI
jgi:hypothetical protein